MQAARANPILAAVNYLTLALATTGIKDNQAATRRARAPKRELSTCDEPFDFVFAMEPDFMCRDMKRQAHVKRITKETSIDVKLNIDGSGKGAVRTGVPFFDHMLTLLAKHAVIDLTLRCKGDLDVDAHHTVEDCGIALGEAFYMALGDKKGLRRYGSGFHPKNPFTGEAYVPMDECLARCVVDFGGRAHLVWRGLDKLAHKKLTKAEKTQDMSSAFRFGLAKEFFQAFANEARCNLHLELLYGEEPHHVVEALFKAFARAADAACRHDSRISGQVPSTKGKL